MCHITGCREETIKYYKKVQSQINQITQMNMKQAQKTDKLTNKIYTENLFAE